MADRGAGGRPSRNGSAGTWVAAKNLDAGSLTRLRRQRTSARSPDEMPALYFLAARPPAPRSAVLVTGTASPGLGAGRAEIERRHRSHFIVRLGCPRRSRKGQHPVQLPTRPPDPRPSHSARPVPSPGDSVSRMRSEADQEMTFWDLAAEASSAREVLAGDGVDDALECSGKDWTRGREVDAREANARGSEIAAIRKRHLSLLEEVAIRGR